MILRPYQQKAVNQWLLHVKKSSEGTLIKAPTGSGKSLILAECIREYLKNNSSRVIVLSHVKEIIEQNAKALSVLVPEHSVGIFAGKRKTAGKITVASIQTFINHYKKWDFISLIVIDEAHRVPVEDEGSYRKVLKHFKDVPVLGLTATPYRLKGGSLLDGDIFKSICFSISEADLVKQGYLSALISKSSVIQGDLSGVRKVAGEYNLGQISERMNRAEITEQALGEVFHYAKASDRKSALFFCTGVDHVKEITKVLKEKGVKAEAILGDTLPMLRDKYIQAFKRGEITALVSCEVLTTGFDAPGVDVIVLLRPTLSTSLYCQMVGRGMRIAKGKKDCLVLDYAGNLLRHGPIDQIDIKPKGERKKTEGAPVFKACPKCRDVTATGTKECASCGFLFPFTPGELYGSAADIDPMSFVNAIKSHEVVETRVLKRPSKGCEMVVLVFDTKTGSYCEYLCFDHPGYAAKIAKRKWKTYFNCEDVPESTFEAMSYIEFKSATPKSFSKVYTKQEGQWNRVLSADEGEEYLETFEDII